MIQIFCVVTSVYKEYFEGFIKSLENFFPEDDKVLTLLTDDTEIIQKYPYGDKIKIEAKYFPHLLYPTINLNKPLLFNDNLSFGLAHGAKYTFIIDVDTVFIENKNGVWDEMKELMDNGKILLTRHPFYSIADGEKLWNASREQLIQNLYSFNLTEKDNRFSSFIPDAEYTYINSSFWGGNPNAVNNFNNLIASLTKMDLSRYPFGWHIPLFMDENYVNKVYWLQEKKSISTGVDVHAGTFSVLGGDVKNNIAGTVFMKQKNLASGVKAYT